MARDSKLQVAAINIRIPVERNYVELLTELANLRRGIRVYGDSYVAISGFDPKTGRGLFSKYTEIDINGDWFDIDEFSEAGPEKIDEIRIPENLKPNLSQFYFELNHELHVIAFSSYAESKNLSTKAVEKYFKGILISKKIVLRFGRVEADIIKSYGEVEKILKLPHLRELRLIIRRPNSDDIGEDLAKIIEERLKSQNADEYEEVLKSKNNDIKPNEETHNLAQVAAENGQVKAKSIVNGVLVDQDTSEVPLTEVIKYKSDESELRTFMGLARKIFEKISNARARLNG